MSEKYLGESVYKLGFGFMRLPQSAPGEFDLELINKMVDTFIERGGTYFDTAYVYPGSEVAMRKTLVERHPRDTYTIASKMPIVSSEKPEDIPEKFEESLSRLGIEYFDFYLLHALTGELLKKSEKLGAWEYLLGEKAKGRIRHLGFSFHGPATELEEILVAHPEAEFVQLQLNYLDWEDEGVQSGKCWEVARKYNKPIVIMEPVKGGILAAEESPVTPILKEYAPEKSVASWAVRFAASLEGIITTLSGMNAMEQLTDNMNTVDALAPFTAEEKDVLKKAVDKINSIPRVPCTGCRYCVPGCPMQIKIPDILRLYNNYLAYNTTTNTEFAFFGAIAGAGKPSECVKCRKCEEECPQHIKITEILEKAAALYEK